MTQLRVSYDDPDTVAEMIGWLVDSDTIELRDLALNLLHDLEAVKAAMPSTVEWGVRTTATMPGAAVPETRVHRCNHQQQAINLLGYYRNHYSQHPGLNGTAGLVCRAVGAWDEVPGDG